MKQSHTLLCGLLLSASTLFTSAVTAATSEEPVQCDAEKNWVKADYTLTETTNNKVRSRSLTLWRKPDVVAHQYPASDITQVWEHVHERVKQTRFFDAHKRGIEYQPGENIHGRVDNDWEYRNQLVKQAFIDGLEKQDSQGSGCDIRTRYTAGSENGHIELVWANNLQLIVSFTVTKGEQKMHWQQQSLSHEQAGINAFFASRYGYQTTDYADIGDDHTDPFLTNMVHQGFIEAGASGFYNASGEALEGSHLH